MKKRDYLLKFIGQPVAILCVRYKYRGIVREVGDDYCVLSNAFAVISGDASLAEAPMREDATISDLFISIDSIEIVHQPVWCFSGYKTSEVKK